MKLFRQLRGLGVLCCCLFLAGCGPKDPGTPPEVLLDGVSVVVGESTPGSLKEQGFEVNDLGAMIFELPDRSWTSSLFLEKDGVNYASMSLVNSSKEKKFVDQCVIEELGFYALDDKNKDLNISINGINPIGKTQEELKELYPDLELDDDDGDYLFHNLRDGEYTIQFQYGKGVLTDIDVMHSFSKSYQTK
ncbi:MAG: hypothetical protein K2P02_09560 [Lachnospiraceae bacterium]|nr:hypothetical protein [Lachnospiraceae bacterium]MDE6930992.1 hypothetical protein [Lachnospiraceae bacterium]